METAAQLPTAILAAGAGATAILILLLVRRLRNTSARFLILALSTRYLVSAFHHFTYDPLVGGLSIVALVSALVFAVGIVLLPPRRLMLKALAPIYAFAVAIAISAALNPESAGGFVDVVVKWGYFLVILLHAREAAMSLGIGKVSALLLWALAAPFLFQIASLILGVSKATEADGSVSYIGGYNHEAAFSVMGLTALMLAGFASVLRGWSIPIVALAVCSIVLANYRTALIAAAPFLLCWAVSAVALRVARRDRLLVGAVVAILVVAGGAGAVAFMQDRFADFAAVWGRELPSAPTQFTDAERDLFSSRLYLWSQYLDGYSQGGALQWLFGQGPEIWTERFITYAHNTAISTLYEYGIAGLLCLFWLWGAGLAMSLRIADRTAAARLVGAHVSIILLNMSTMGQWLVEGLILYALVYAYTMVLARAHATRPVTPILHARSTPNALVQS